MRTTPQNVPATSAHAKEMSGDIRVVRRVEIIVERRLCSVEIRGGTHLQHGHSCPLCGAEFMQSNTEGLKNEVKR